ncbi:MAG: NADPH:quinone oxidoreductase family protein [Myxococcales bacterium]|nr:NADPH:quinone oxidoreductase family protein [Polyangiaceae bacterium]MDW8249516.1 NADPH:quinone oxidoreductase family protein [Myxococcales bacterium]
MRAVRVHELTGPAGLRLEEVEAPRAGPGEVLIDVKAAGVNFPDVLLSWGKYQFKPPLPFSPGGEVAGLVAAVGPGVTGFAPGDRVASFMIHGAFAEQVVVPQEAVVALPEGVPFEVGASVMVTHGTTMHALVDRARLRPGETLLVLGAAGGVGIAAVELGKVLGARVIAAASRDEKLAFCKERGADEVICYSQEDLKERVKTLTGGNGADVVYDPVGGDWTEAALRSTAWEGRLLIVGFASGTIPKIPMNLVLLKGCQITGVFWGSFAAREPARNRAHLAQCLAWIEEGKLRPHVEEVLPFERAAEALERLERRAVLGKLTLAP